MPDLYGDLINGITLSAALPLSIYKALEQSSPDLYLVQLVVCTTGFAVARYSVKSWWNRDEISSYLSFAFMMMHSVVIIYFQWPVPGNKFAV
jgi:hypothetical protein